MKKVYRPNFFRDWLFNPIIWVILVFVAPIMVIVSTGIAANETNKSFWEVFWATSQDLEYKSPIISPNIPYGIEILIIAVGIPFLIFFFLWVITAIFDKVTLTDEFIKYYGQRVKLSDIERIAIGEAGLSVIEKFYPSAPKPAELPQAVTKGRIKFDLPRWLLNTKFFDDLKKLVPEIKINLPPKPKAYLLSLALFYFLVFVGVILGFGAGFAWFLWILKLPFTHLGNFDFVSFAKNYPFIEKAFIGGGGLIAIVYFLFLGLGLVMIYDKNWRRAFLKSLAFLGLLHFLGWLLSYFGILK